MQSPKSLLAFGVGAVVAATAIAASPVAAEPGLLRRQPSPPEGTTPKTDQITEHSDSSSEIAQNSTEQRLDRLQRQSEIRQQLNEAQYRTLDQGSSGANSLQLEQEVQQQINLQDLQTTRQNIGTMPSDGLDRLQFEQRVRQRLQQPNGPQSKVTLAQADAAPVETTNTIPESAPLPPESDAQAAAEAVEQAEAVTPAETVPSTEAGTPTEAETKAEASTETTSTETTVEESATRPTAPQRSNQYARSNRHSSKAEAAQNQSETTPPPAEAAETVAAPAEPSAASASEPQAELAQETPSPSPEATSESTDSPTPDSTTEAVEEKPDPEVDAQSESADRPAAESSKPNRTQEQAEDRIDRQNRDYPDDSEAPAPEYLDPDANPLSFPTQPDEVDLVGTQPITLQQAIQLAIRNNPVLQQERLQLERTQAALRETEASNYPTLDVNASFTQRGQESFQEERETFAQTNDPQQPITTVTVPSETIYTDSTALGANLELSYPIYTSGRRSSLIQAAQGQVRLQQLEVERQTEDLILNTTQDYYDLQQASAQVNIFTANLTEAAQSLRDAQALERAGVGTRFDVLQAEVDVANARQELTQQLSQLDIARRQLAQRLSLANALNIEAADVIEVAGVWDLSLPETIVNAYKNRAELEQQLIQREIAQKNRQAALAQLGPQLGFNGSFGVTNDLDRDPGFLYNYQLGLTASLSLYDGGQARSQADQQESNIAIAELEFQNTKDQIRFQVEQAYSQLDSNFANIQTTALAVEQAAEALRLARLRFQAGVGTQTDVLRQQTALAQAQVNNLRAILDYNRAIASLQRQVSNYPEDVLNDQP